MEGTLMLPQESLVFALLDTSAAIAEFADIALAAKLRDLTISWSRFKHSGPMLEGADLDELLARAAAGGARYCLVQAWGHVLQEVWTPGRQGNGDFVTGLLRWASGRDFLAAGSSSCLLVDLGRFQRQGTITEDDLAGAVPFPQPLAATTAWLTADSPAAAAQLRSWLGPGIADLDRAAAARSWGEPAARFLADVQRLTANLPRGVFVWNIEPYDDVQPPDDFVRPLSTLYSVAAGFKPNWILETHGFDERTRVVFYDYSEAGLEFRRLLLEEWDGADYPSFLRRLFQRLPSSRAFYCLWDGATPETLDWDEVEARWRQELDRWGGASVLRAHWRRYRRLPHERVGCNLLRDAGPLLARLRDEPSAVIWWSNAFFTVYSNWMLAADRRQAIYRRWIERLARSAPRLLLYGATADNVSVNFVRAAEYWDWYQSHAGDELAPGSLHRVEILF
jgi:hypothetical protein